VFADPAVARGAIEVLRQHARKESVPIFGYCVMPDHGHLVLGPSVTCDVVTFVGQFKNLSQRAAWHLGVEGAFWQVGFWDRILRREESVEAAVTYVLGNPVRAGLVQRWQDYEFSGSLVFKLR
jgi:REP element-mobilizing transposase RayT